MRAFLTLIMLIQCALFGDVLPDISKVGIDAVKNWAENRSKEAGKNFSSQRFPSPSNWQDEVVYQIVVDRFANGDITNDALNLNSENERRFLNGSGTDFDGLPDWRHGGDLQGIIDRLDYLANLTVTALWITPILYHDGSYHGYCTTDLTQIDPGFGTNELFRKLVAEAHKRGLKVILDVVINHMCDRKTYYSSSFNHQNCASDLMNAYWLGTPADTQNAASIQFSNSFFPPLKSQYFFNRCGTDSIQEMQGETAPALFGDFSQGMFDYNTQNYDFQEIFTSLMNFWIAYADVDGFRLDAAKHVTADFVAYLSTKSREFANSVGKDNFLVVGEVAASADWVARRVTYMQVDPHNIQNHGNVPKSVLNRIYNLQATYLAHPKQAFPGLTSVYNFAESGTMRDMLWGERSPTDLQNFPESEFARTLYAQVDPNVLWTLLEIHDWPRYLSRSPGSWERLRSGVALLISLPGAPILYYGVEAAFSGVCGDYINAGKASDSIRGNCNGQGDALKRQDFFINSPWRLRSAIFDDRTNFAYIGDWDYKKPSELYDPYLDINFHPWGKLLRQYLKLRQSCQELRSGELNINYASSSLISISRKSDKREMVTLVNVGRHGESVQKIPIDKNLNPVSGRKFVDMLGSQAVGYVGFEDQAYLYFANSMYVDVDQAFIFIDELQISNRNEINACK